MTQNSSQYIQTVQTRTIQISSGTSSTGSIDLVGMQLRKIFFPSNWTPCNIRFTDYAVNALGNTVSAILSDADGTYPLSIATVANQSLPVIPWFFDSSPIIQIICSTNQVQSVELTLLLQPIYQGVHN